MPQGVVVGSGPNGLVGAIYLARAGFSVTVLEEQEEPGGGLRSYINEPFGTIHDHCSAVHPMAWVSPVFRQLGMLQDVPMAFPPSAFEHPLCHRERNRRDGLFLDRLHSKLAKFAGVAAHSMRSPYHPWSLGTGTALGALAWAVGWPVVVGGSGRIAEYLVRVLEAHGGKVRCNSSVNPDKLPDDLATADVVLWDTDIPTAHRAAGAPSDNWQFGPGVAKADFVTDRPIPWENSETGRAGTIHLGGTWNEIVRAERDVARGVMPRHPVSLVSQPSLFDSTRAPEGLHTVWAYSHVPSDSDVDPVSTLRDEIELRAPGFGNSVIDARGTTASGMTHHNRNFRGGDIFSGATRGSQMLTSRWPHSPWSLPVENWFVCSQATPPGPGVHGINGYIAARLALMYWSKHHS